MLRYDVTDEMLQHCLINLTADVCERGGGYLAWFQRTSHFNISHRHCKNLHKCRKLNNNCAINCNLIYGLQSRILMGITKRRTGLENGMENRTENETENRKVASNPFNNLMIFFL